MRTAPFLSAAIQARWLLGGALLLAAHVACAQSGSQTILDGRKLFTQGVASLPACALCHALKDASATGVVGPDLDDLRPDAARIEHVLRNGMGPMPAFKSLSDAQIALLVRYVSQATGSLPASSN